VSELEQIRILFSSNAKIEFLFSLPSFHDLLSLGKDYRKRQVELLVKDEQSKDMNKGKAAKDESIQD